MANIQVEVINASTVLTDEKVKSVLPALQTQVHRDFAPVWGIDAHLNFVGKGANPNPRSWHLTILDNSDQAGTLGYHDMTEQGLPLGKVFAATDMQNGNAWTATASHELLEMLADPEINLTVLIQKNQSQGLLYAYEVCDPCDPDNYGYKIDGILVSDFLYPTWFELFHQPGITQFDHCKHIRKPFEILPGGYIGIFNVASNSGWQQASLEGDRLQWNPRASVGSRRERRKTPRTQWFKSKVTQPKLITNQVVLPPQATTAPEVLLPPQATTSPEVVLPPQATTAPEVVLPPQATTPQQPVVVKIGNQTPLAGKRPVIKHGSKGEWVSYLQNALNGFGYGPLVVDGDFGNQTITAVKKFQQSLNLTADGVVGDQTWQALDHHKNQAGKPQQPMIVKIGNQIPPPAKRPVLKQGASGEWVSCLQNALNGCGCGPLVVDGDFGNQTVTEVKKFQQNLNLTADGIADEEIWQAVDNYEKLPYWLNQWPSSLNFTGVPGVDTMQVVTPTSIQEATKMLGARPGFWGRYFFGRDAEYRGGVENKILHDYGIRVAPVGRETNVINGNYNKGIEVGGKHAADVLVTFGEDYLAAHGGAFYIFLDTEPAPQPTLSTDYYLGWSKAIAGASKKVRFLPAVYLNHGDDRAAQALKLAIEKGAECFGLWVANYGRSARVSPWKSVQAQAAIDVNCPVLIHQYIGDVEGGVYDFNEINPYLDEPNNLVLNRLILPPG